MVYYITIHGYGFVFAEVNVLYFVA